MCAELNGINAKSLSGAHHRDGMLQIYRWHKTERLSPVTSAWQSRVGAEQPQMLPFSSLLHRSRGDSDTENPGTRGSP